MCEFQRVSLLQILGRLYPARQRPKLYFPNTLVERLRSQHLHVLHNGRTHHLYYSKHNQGADALIAELITLVTPSRRVDTRVAWNRFLRGCHQQISLIRYPI